MNNGRQSDLVPSTWLPEVVAKIQIRPEDLAPPATNALRGPYILTNGLAH